MNLCDFDLQDPAVSWRSVEIGYSRWWPVVMIRMMSYFKTGINLIHLAARKKKHSVYKEILTAK